jgi:hypothetical protein
MLSRIVASAVVLLGVAALAGAPAGAEPSPGGPTVVVGDQRGRYSGGVVAPGHGKGPRQSKPDVNTVPAGDPTPPPPPGVGASVGIAVANLPAQTPAQAAQAAYTTLELPQLQIARNPAGKPTVGLALWLWVDQAQWSTPYRTSATAGGVTVTLTAVPQTLRFTPGDGNPAIDCDGPGAAYDSEADGCTYTYRRSSAGQPDQQFAAEATVIWQVTWAATNGDGGAFPAADRSQATPLTVLEVQVVGGR